MRIVACAEWNIQLRRSINTTTILNISKIYHFTMSEEDAITNDLPITMLNARQFFEAFGSKLNSLIEKTKIKSAVEKTLNPVMNWAMKNSLFPLHFGIKCCALEMAAAFASRYDLERYGVVARSSPRQCDVLIVNGPVTYKLKLPLRRLYDQIPDPKWVIAMGECATCGGPYFQSYNVVMGADKIFPVDIYIPGCPPRPEALLDGFLKLRKKIEREYKIEFKIK